MSSLTLTESLMLFILTLITMDQLPKYVSSTCPSDMIEVDSSICVVQVNSTNTLCEAGHQCALYARTTGRQVFLVGRNHQKIIDKVNETTVYMWTSLNLFLSHVIKTKVGWSDGDPRDPRFRVTREDQLAWASGQPDGNQVASVVSFSTKLFRDAGRDLSFYSETVCELVSAVHSDLNTVEYRADYPFPLPINLFSLSQDFDGCVSSISTSTLLSCTLQCTWRPECRSVYFNESKKICLLVLYFDARIPTQYVNLEGTWQRYAKVTGSEEVSVESAST